MKIKLDDERRRRIILEGQNVWYAEQLQLAKTNPIEFASQGLEIFEKISDKMIDVAARNKKEKDNYAS